jgi:cysteine synthase B
VEPAGALHGLEGLKHMASSIVPGIYQVDELDGVLPIETEPAWDLSDRLAKEEGIFVGHSSGANLLGALEIASRIKEGVVVTIFTDSGDRYFTGLNG